MAHRKMPLATVQVHAAGFRYAMTKPAWSAYRPVANLIGLGQVTSDTETADVLNLPGVPGTTNVQLSCWMLDKTVGDFIYLRPFLDSAMPPTYDVLTYLGGAADATYGRLSMPGSWQEGVVMDSADTVQGFGVFESKFQLCRDGWFAFELWRAKVEPEPDAESEEEPEIEENDAAISDRITWGVATGINYQIDWFRNGTAKLWCGNTYSDRFAVNLSVNTQAEEGELLSLMIGVLGGHMVVFDRNTDELTSFRPTEADVTWEPTTIRFWHGFGSAWLSVNRVLFHEAILSGHQWTDRTLVSGDTFATYVGGYSATASGVGVNAYGDAPWTSGDEPDWTKVNFPTPGGSYVLRSLRAGELALGVRYFASHTAEWKLKLMPWYLDNLITIDSVETNVRTYATPAMAALCFSQPAVLTDNGDPAVQYDLTTLGVVKDAECDEPDQWGSTQLTVSLDAMTHVAAAIVDMRMVTFSAVGWWLSDGTQRVETNFAKLFALEPEVNGRVASMPCLDLLSVLSLSVFDQALPVFDGDTVAHAMAWLLEVAGVGTAWRDLEDLYHAATSADVGRLTWGTWRKPLWMPKRGAGLIAFFREMLKVCGMNAAIWADNGVLKTGCRYCGTKRSGNRGSADYWALHCDNGWESTGCRAADVVRAGNADGVDRELFAAPELVCDPDEDGLITRLRTFSKRLDTQETANYVSVAGEDDQEQTYVAIKRNVADIASLGMVLGRVETSNAIRSQADANQVALTLYNELAHSARYCEGTILLDPKVRRGHVVRLHTIGRDPWGVDEDKYRVVNVRHSIRHGSPYSTFTGRYISA